jgi:hypothetical protein
MMRAWVERERAERAPEREGRRRGGGGEWEEAVWAAGAEAKHKAVQRGARRGGGRRMNQKKSQLLLI